MPGHSGGSVRSRLGAIRLEIVSQDSGASAELAALSRALDRIEAMPGSRAKTAAIREVAEGLGKLDARAAKMREAEVLRISRPARKQARTVCSSAMSAARHASAWAKGWPATATTSSKRRASSGSATMRDHSTPLRDSSPVEESRDS